MDCSIDSVFAAFSNPLVWRKLGNYLNYSDLKVCRIVCKEFNLKVMEETRFKVKTIVTLHEKNLCQPGFGTTAWKWTNIEILPFQMDVDSNDAGHETVDFNWLYPLLSNVECLVIGGKHVYSDALVYPPLQYLIEAPTGLKKLSVDVFFWCKKNEHVFTTPSSGVCKSLQGLSDFGLLAHVRGPLTASSDSIFFDSLEIVGKFLNNLQLIKVDNIVAENLSSMPDSVDEEMHSKLKTILQIIEVNSTRITNMQLHDFQLWSTSLNEDLLSVPVMSFPSLKVVKIRMNQIDIPNVTKFLEAQPLLEELDITVLNSLPSALMAKIGERGVNLKRLRIATKVLENYQPITWIFLSRLEKLEEFQLNLIKSFNVSLESCENCVASAIFGSLPRCVKQITLRGLPNPRRHIPSPTLVASDFVNINPLAITVLNLSKCFECVDDNTLEFIFRNCRSMISLNLSDSNACTDYGFTGLPLPEGGLPFSVADMKGLKSLTLRACGVISDRTLIEGIKFLELRFLDICNNSRITEAGCLTVLSQNPSLEIFLTREFDEFPTEEELKKRCPRLQQHTYPHDDYSEDEDASVHDFESDFSGGGYNRCDDFYDAVESEDFDDNDFDDEDEDWL